MPEQHVFTYGSLMFPEVWNRVVRGNYRSCPARLDGYRRHALVDASYPAIVADAGASVDGVLYFDVDAADLARLDAFEGVEYRRDAVPVSTASGPAMAQAYVWLDAARLAHRPWLPERFSIPEFLGAYPPASLLE
jgi:gamma-glutamylcyclotransferase (GGCT)/AIG2-like uncharacterized protein YtfP